MRSIATTRSGMLPLYIEVPRLFRRNLNQDYCLQPLLVLSRSSSPVLPWSPWTYLVAARTR